MNTILSFSNFVTILQYYGYADEIYGVPIQPTSKIIKNKKDVPIGKGIYKGLVQKVLDTSIGLRGLSTQFYENESEWTDEPYKVIDR